MMAAQSLWSSSISRIWCAHYGIFSGESDFRVRPARLWLFPDTAPYSYPGCRRPLAGTGGAEVAALFHDEELDGPLPDRPLVLVPTLVADRAVAEARTAGYGDVELIGIGDVAPGGEPAGEGRPVDDGLPSPERSPVAGAPAAALRPEPQLAVLAVRLEMAAAYLRLVEGAAS